MGPKAAAHPPVEAVEGAKFAWIIVGNKHSPCKIMMLDEKITNYKLDENAPACVENGVEVESKEVTIERMTAVFQMMSGDDVILDVIDDHGRLHDCQHKLTQLATFDNFMLGGSSYYLGKAQTPTEENHSTFATFSFMPGHPTEQYPPAGAGKKK